MKPVSEMTRLELACYIGAEFKRRNVSVILSGGSRVTIWCEAHRSLMITGHFGANGKDELPDLS